MLRNTTNNTQRICMECIKCTNYSVKPSDDIPYSNDISDMPINIKVAFHFMAPRGSYNKNKVFDQTHNIIMSLNNDFNNYSTNPNIMNNFKYKSIINQVFISNMDKQNIYLGENFLNEIPSEPSEITFEFGELYYYPITSQLQLSEHNNNNELTFYAIKEYININRADAIEPEKILNIWIIDVVGTSVLGFSDSPWEEIDYSHGIILNRKIFFPDADTVDSYGNLKTITHHVGHYLGLCHTDNNDDRIRDVTDKLLTDLSYNPMFMNFMDYTYDKYVGIFTIDQIIEMRQMISSYRHQINSITNNVILPTSKYNPDTNLMNSVNTFSEQPYEYPIKETSEPIVNKTKKTATICRVTRKINQLPNNESNESKIRHINYNTMPSENSHPKLSAINNLNSHSMMKIQPELNSISNINYITQSENSHPKLSAINDKICVEDNRPILNSISTTNDKLLEFNLCPQLSPIEPKSEIDCEKINRPKMESIAFIPNLNYECKNAPALKPICQSNIPFQIQPKFCPQTNATNTTTESAPVTGPITKSTIRYHTQPISLNVPRTSILPEGSLHPVVLPEGSLSNQPIVNESADPITPITVTNILPTTNTLADHFLLRNKYGQINQQHRPHRSQMTVRTVDAPSNRFVRTRPIGV